jgi:hypothetical protein
MRMPHVRSGLQRLRARRRRRSLRWAEKTHMQDMAGKDRGDASTKGWDRS